MVIKKSLSSGEIVEVTAASATSVAGRAAYYSVYGTPQNVIDFLTEERIPMSNVIGVTYTSSSELCVMYHK